MLEALRRMSNEKVSVVISTHNRRDLLRRSLDSVIKQTYSNIEIIVSDDFSDYDVQALIVEYKYVTNFPIIYRRNIRNMGACYTRNQGIALATGAYVTGLDDDDEFTSDRIQTLVDNYDEKLAFVTTNTFIVSNSGGKKMFRTTKKKVINFDNLLWENVIGTQVLTSLEKIKSVGGFDESLDSGQDVDLWLRLVQEYGLALRLPSCGYILHTEHEKKRISSSEKKIKGWEAVYLKYAKYRTPSQLTYCKLKIGNFGNNIKFYISLLKTFDLRIYFYLVKRIYR